MLGVLALLPPCPGVTKANFDRIQKGMTKGEVEGIFGGKGEIVANGMVWSAEEGNFVFNPRRIGCCWSADDGSRAVIEFSDDCVDLKDWRGSNDTMLDKLRRWLHLR
jgi:hypothetical protein